IGQEIIEDCQDRYRTYRNSRCIAGSLDGQFQYKIPLGPILSVPGTFHRRTWWYVPVGDVDQKGKRYWDLSGIGGKCHLDLVYQCIYKYQLFDVRLLRGS